MFHWIDCGIVYLCYHSSSSWCIWLIVTLLICFLVTLPHVVFDWLWYFYLCSHGSSSCCIVLIVTIIICVLMVLPHVALDWLWHRLSVFLWFFLMLHWIDSDIVCLCSYGSSSCCIGFIVTLFFFVLMVRPHFALDWLWYCFSVFLCFYLMLHWINCGIVYLCSHGSSSSCIGLIVTLFFCVLMVLPHVALDWLRYCLPVFSLFFFMLPWIDCAIVFFVFSWFFVMLLLIYCDIVYLCSHGSSSCCIGLIVALFICVLMGLPYVALDWLWHCLSLFLWVFFMLIGFIVGLFICVLMVLSHVALDWLWHCLSVF